MYRSRLHRRNRKHKREERKYQVQIWPGQATQAQGFVFPGLMVWGGFGNANKWLFACQPCSALIQSLKSSTSLFQCALVPGFGRNTIWTRVEPPGATSGGTTVVSTVTSLPSSRRIRPSGSGSFTEV